MAVFGPGIKQQQARLAPAHCIATTVDADAAQSMSMLPHSQQVVQVMGPCGLHNTCTTPTPPDTPQGPLLAQHCAYACAPIILLLIIFLLIF
jgi:hypothetical protein